MFERQLRADDGALYLKAGSSGARIAIMMGRAIDGRSDKPLPKPIPLGGTAIDLASWETCYQIAYFTQAPFENFYPSRPVEFHGALEEAAFHALWLHSLNGESGSSCSSYRSSACLLSFYVRNHAYMSYLTTMY